MASDWASERVHGAFHMEFTVAFRLAPEWISIDLNGLTGPDWSGKCALAPE
jgi:hypothetical protein